jgi:putative salt-induced outer membrane protein
MNARTTAVALLLLTPLTAHLALADPPPPPKQGISGEVDFGWVATRGNTQNSTTKFKGEVDYDTAPWHFSLLGAAVGASESGQTTAEAYKLSGKAKYDLSQAIYLFGLLDYNKDRFSGYDHQIYETGGFGWHVYKSAAQELNLEAGVGATQSKTREITGPPLVPSENRNEVVGRLGVEYIWQISPTATFSEKASSLIGGDNTYVESSTELKVKVVSQLALVLGYLVKYNTQVPEGTQKTDSLSSVSLAWKF